mmetsp:Transcript_32285/g.83799  ORF Transcript_32285/g.83799 Transcript_32285/m.83799 type:complete len:87 (+) Transcript_32285:197-457(+)
MSSTNGKGGIMDDLHTLHQQRGGGRKQGGYVYPVSVVQPVFGMPFSMHQHDMNMRRSGVEREEGGKKSREKEGGEGKRDRDVVYKW